MGASGSRGGAKARNHVQPNLTESLSSRMSMYGKDAFCCNGCRDMLAALGLPGDPDRAPPLPLAEDDSNWETPPVGDLVSRGLGPDRASSGSLLVVSGCVRLLSGDKVMELSGSRLTALRVREWPLWEANIVMGESYEE